MKFKLREIKVIRVLKGEPGVIYIKKLLMSSNVLGKRKYPVNFNTVNCIPA
jgi:hypothetical protein